MSAILRLIRIQNLIFIAFIQLVMQKVIIVPVLQTYGFDYALDNMMLLLLIITSVLIAAGGYVLNDYFDVKIDTINKPERLIVGNLISRHSAMLMHQILTAIGVVCGLLLAYFARSFTLGFIFIVVPGLLWFYSASYKRQFITGNLVIAFISALSILVVGINQLAFLQKEFGKLIFETPIPTHFYAWIGGFALFSFLITWIREIIKDIEDEAGDREMECRTMPIKWGITRTKWFIFGLIITINAALYFVYFTIIPFEDDLTLRYIIFAISLPFLALGYLIYVAKIPAEFHQASTLTKVIMLLGILYSFIFYYLQAKTFGISLFNIFVIK